MTIIHSSGIGEDDKTYVWIVMHEGHLNSIHQTYKGAERRVDLYCTECLQEYPKMRNSFSVKREEFYF